MLLVKNLIYRLRTTKRSQAKPPRSIKYPQASPVHFSSLSRSMQDGIQWLRDCFHRKELARVKDNKLDIGRKSDEKEWSPKQVDAEETESTGEALLV